MLLVAATERGLAAVRLGDDGDELIDELRTEYPQATLQVIAPDSDDEPEFRRWAQVVYAVIQNEANDSQRYSALSALPLDIQATAFQRRVWEALRAIPVGDIRSYAEIAEAIGQPEAVRAVARAIATNPVAVVIPCHRVIRSDGQLSGYRWGMERKHRLLEREGALERVASGTQQRLF
jgi:AraC family transcriptional regulator, regulatory protein of adaptative response / methylated-DNA-[protein]-cysteine methyltransferase